MSILIDKNRCTGCNYCTITCPTKAIRLEIQANTWPSIDSHLCISCGDCIYVCPNNVFSSTELTQKPHEISNYYDAIVIGAGIGGLMTAAGLAKGGLKTLVVEQLSFIGGKYTHLMQSGYAISTAAWTCPGPKSRIGKLCTKLGADIQWITIHDVNTRGDHWVALKDGRKFKSLDEAQETLVGGKQGMRKVYRWISDMYNPRVHYPDDLTTRQYMQRFFHENAEYEQYVETIITHCFASQTLDTFSAMETKRAIVDSLEQMADWGTAIGGTAAIVSGIEKVLRQNGGQIVTCTKVASIIIENGSAKGIILEDGRRINAKTVIHNAGLNRLINLAGKEKLPKEYLTRLREAIPANVAALILGTREPLLGQDHSLLHSMGWERTLNCYAPTFFDPNLAPKGRHALDVFWVLKPPYDKRSEYDLVLAQLRQIFPNFNQDVETQTPMFFSGMWTAEMAHRMGQSGKDRLDPQSPITNLYLVGYDCIGYGMAGDIIPHSVQKALYEILRDPTYMALDEKFISKANKWIKAQVFKILALV